MEANSGLGEVLKLPIIFWWSHPDIHLVTVGAIIQLVLFAVTGCCLEFAVINRVITLHSALGITRFLDFVHCPVF
jgi:hypothetical protein